MIILINLKDIMNIVVNVTCLLNSYLMNISISIRISRFMLTFLNMVVYILSITTYGIILSLEPSI